MKRIFAKIGAFFARIFSRKKIPESSPLVLTALDLVEQYQNKKEGKPNDKRRTK